MISFSSPCSAIIYYRKVYASSSTFNNSLYSKNYTSFIRRSIIVSTKLYSTSIISSFKASSFIIKSIVTDAYSLISIVVDLIILYSLYLIYFVL